MFRFLIVTILFGFAACAVLPEGLVPVLDGRIVGGQNTTIEEFPHQISMKSYGNHKCGGSIISKKLIISAAHCVYGFINPKALTIVVGTSYKNSGGKAYNVKKIVVHEEYNPSIVDNDISLLLLSTPLIFGDSVQPIALAEFGEIINDGTPVLVSGWGTLQEGGKTPIVLQYVQVNVINSKACADMYEPTGGKITEHMLCAGVEKGGKDSCQGDSGGPLIFGNKLVGVVSWGFGCAQAKFPGVYAKVSVLRKWIETNKQILM